MQLADGQLNQRPDFIKPGPSREDHHDSIIKTRFDIDGQVFLQTLQIRIRHDPDRRYDSPATTR